MSQFKLKRIGKPVLEPEREHLWESRAVFNPATIIEDDVIHMLYRAVEENNSSTLGYARFDNEGKLLKRSDQPVILREYKIERKGCEDPRIVFWEGVYYIFYTGFDGKDITQGINARVMLAETKDFYTYKKYGRVGPDIQNKDAMIFPEKIDGKMVFIHRIAPNIQIALFDNMQHFLTPEANYWQHHLDNIDKHTILYKEQAWEKNKIGAGPPPILTEAGWLLIYHGVDEKKVYRAGAALLEEKNPFKVIARLPYPILEPETEFERYGDVNNVVFPEGTVKFENELWVYYGAADKVVALAIGNLSLLIEALWKNRL
jgi:predicted GH43/DUF377 family glycosyl hydrolase